MVKHFALWSICVLTVATAAIAADGPALRGFQSRGLGGPAVLAQGSPTPIPPIPGVYDSEPHPPAPQPLGYVAEPLPQGHSVPTFDDVPYSVSEPVELYDNVRYRGVRKIHPCAVPMIVQVPDPCQDPCDTCGPRCVNIEICVPPCECPKIKCRRNGQRMIYDFGKYEVAITSARGIVSVAYAR